MNIFDIKCILNFIDGGSNCLLIEKYSDNFIFHLFVSNMHFSFCKIKKLHVFNFKQVYLKYEIREKFFMQLWDFLLF